MKSIVAAISLVIISVGLSFLFTTAGWISDAKREFVLDVPVFQQELMFQCNITAAQMVLAYYGHNLTPAQIYLALPKQLEKYDVVNKTWGDPNLGYVGDITGKSKGYGIHWGPMSEFISQYQPTRVERRWNLTALLQEVKSGHPVILWWQNGSTTPNKLAWRTKSGTEIVAVEGMHSEVVVGFTGDSENPESVILNDPWRGRRSVAVSEFTQLWDYYDNTAVVVLS